jgi:hypothetical protein
MYPKLIISSFHGLGRRAIVPGRCGRLDLSGGVNRGRSSSMNPFVLHLESLVTDLEAIHLLDGLLGGHHRIIRYKT